MSGSSCLTFYCAFRLFVPNWSLFVTLLFVAHVVNLFYNIWLSFFLPKIRASYATLELGCSNTVLLAIFKNGQIAADRVPTLIKFGSKKSSSVRQSFHFPKTYRDLQIYFFGYLQIQEQSPPPKKKKLEIKKFKNFPQVPKWAKFIFDLYFHFVTVKKNLRIPFLLTQRFYRHFCFSVTFKIFWAFAKLKSNIIVKFWNCCSMPVFERKKSHSIKLIFTAL